MALATSGRPARATWALIALTVGTLAQVSGNIANLLTLSRLLCAFPLYVLVGAERYELAFWIFLAAALSDAADGYIAKTFQGRTMTGAVLDPVSDKVLVIALMLALMQQLAIPLWLVVVVIGRDLLVVGGAALLRFRVKNFRVEPLIIGKLCTFLQLVLIGFVLGGLARLADTALVESILIPAVAVVTLASAMAYVATGIRVARGAAGTD